MKIVPTTNKAILVAAALVAAAIGAIAVASAVSNAHTKRMEREVAVAKQRAEAAENAAAALETAAAEYRQKTEYLEKSLAEIQVIARRQDEELEIINSDVDSAAAISSVQSGSVNRRNRRRAL